MMAKGPATTIRYGVAGAYFRGGSGNNLLHQDQLEASREGINDEGLAFDSCIRTSENSGGNTYDAMPQVRACSGTKAQVENCRVVLPATSQLRAVMPEQGTTRESDAGSKDAA